MLLKDLSIGAFPNGKYQEMGLRWQCMEDLYLRNLLPYKNDFIKKLNIDLIGKDDRVLFASTKLPIATFNNLLSIGEVFLYFDFEEYLKKDDYHKKLDLLNKIQEGFEIFAKQTGSDPAPFRNAYQKCLDQKLKNEYVYKESVRKKKGIKVKIFIKVDLDKLEVTGAFYDKDGNLIAEKVFFSRKPEALFHYYLGNVKWTSEKEVILYGRSKEEYWTINL